MDDPPTESDVEMFPLAPGEDDGMSAEDRSMDAEHLHEKWETAPVAQVPIGVQRRLWSELDAVNLEWNQDKEAYMGWDIEMWSARKRRRIQELARAAVDEEKTVCAMRCVCIQPAYAMIGM